MCEATQSPCILTFELPQHLNLPHDMLPLLGTARQHRCTAACTQFIDMQLAVRLNWSVAGAAVQIMLLWCLPV